MRDHTRSHSHFAPDHDEFPLLLHIARGKTDYPDRPIEETPFLIGSGPECHLQLAGGLPSVHCCILQDQETILIESLSRDVPLKVNSKIVKAAILTPGATIEIGPFLFELRKSRKNSNAGLVVELPIETASSKATVPVADELAADPRELSIHGLIDRLESALEKLDELEHRRRTGLASLLEKVIEVATDQSHQESPQRRSA